MGAAKKRRAPATDLVLAELNRRLEEGTALCTSREILDRLHGDGVEMNHGTLSGILAAQEKRRRVIGHRDPTCNVVKWRIYNPKTGDWRKWGYAPGFGPPCAMGRT